MSPELKALKGVLKHLDSNQSNSSHYNLTSIALTHIEAAIGALEDRDRIQGEDAVPKFPTRPGWYYVTLGDMSGFLEVQFIQHHDWDYSEYSGLKLLIEEFDEEFQEAVQHKLIRYYEEGGHLDGLEFTPFLPFE